ncbi:MAG: ASCH domain-containing protein [Nitrosopumilus sp.]|nr:ASCH domain-containing protein [Nitrosopumilus sp.]MDA7941536.1 ASCH domain-containing protein [Nitrosopumilus sp.]MDA7943611.1 ASCH domain-containing protein [Nitrosopumilus sp.]MDA7952858.1 ASCH domain-containing protein [Nitrosopumilus sp.]MDA7954348.1 ASCH domain-containing protein [Nitrosopumilus sp.]
MKCLSLSQPYADLVADGRKTIDLRSWNTRYRGEFLVHAPRKIRYDDCRRLRVRPGATGAIIGKAEITGVVTYGSASEVSRDRARHLAPRGTYRRYGFCISGARRLAAPVPCRGYPWLFEVAAPAVARSEVVGEIIDEESRYRLVGWH